MNSHARWGFSRLTGAAARRAFKELGAHLEAARSAGYRVYDPQLERVIEMGEGIEAGLEVYEATIAGSLG